MQLVLLFCWWGQGGEKERVGNYSADLLAHEENL